MLGQEKTHQKIWAAEAGDLDHSPTLTAAGGDDQLSHYAPIPRNPSHSFYSNTFMHCGVVASQEEGHRLPAVGAFYGGFLCFP